ncbi:MAG: spheroidene monooxygenase [Flavobacteriaceae bacterium]|nr:spheroidene monooxygenase [Flavobacteriaceae bacterium]MBL6678440.1 spheroidene monooxygenase [Flavobacteriaceae bacterium]
MFKLMGAYTFNKSLISFNGLKFIKLFGTGSNGGFSLIPDFSSYVMITSWKNDNYRKKFVGENNIINKIISKSSKRVEIKIDPYNFNGSWNGINPFKNISSYGGGKIIVLTRARVKISKLINFLVNTSLAAKSIKSQNGAEFYKGIGELPIIEQATISIWMSEKSMRDYAYSDKNHLKIINKARKDKWYSEELFVRSNILYLKEFN